MHIYLLLFYYWKIHTVHTVKIVRQNVQWRQDIAKLHLREDMKRTICVIYGILLKLDTWNLISQILKVWLHLLCEHIYMNWFVKPTFETIRWINRIEWNIKFKIVIISTYSIPCINQDLAWLSVVVSWTIRVLSKQLWCLNCDCFYPDQVQ